LAINCVCTHKIVTVYDRSFLFPLYEYSGGQNLLSTTQATKRPNLSSEFAVLVAKRMGCNYLENDPNHSAHNLHPEDLFHYLYGILYSPAYRIRYASSLAIDFPRTPITTDFHLFRGIASLGADLMALHLLEDDYPAASWNISKPKVKSPLQNLITKFAGKGDDEVAKGYPKYGTRKVFINPSRWFEGVPENVWNFHIGGYMVCEKWLKDRRGRVLSDEDTTHYQRVVVALNETIRLMAEIDKVIDAHGGWPAAFIASQPVSKRG